MIFGRLSINTFPCVLVGPFLWMSLHQYLGHVRRSSLLMASSYWTVFLLLLQMLFYSLRAARICNIRNCCSQPICLSIQNAMSRSLSWWLPLAASLCIIPHLFQGFFRRTIKERDILKYQCSRDGSCVITTATRNICKFCRYQKCLEAGMKADGKALTGPDSLYWSKNK